ncbi:MAG: hypothetical protein CMK89_21290 [Pseudomonadales bacterium]|nr:hypothetical protein [Pseudomonadales bacterium]
MKLEYQNGVRIMPGEHELSPFERMLERYSQMADSYYAAEQDTGLTQEQRSAALSKAKVHLDRERGHLKAMADVEGQLTAYRAKGLEATQGSGKQRMEAISVMNAEEHHPTETLEKFMRAEGVPKPSPEHTAHHIVPGKGKLPVVNNQTRMHLHIHGIRINDPANGVYLVHKDADTPHWSMPASRGHLTYHTHEYERWVSQKVTLLKNMDLIKTQLQIIGRILQDNEPKVAIGQ